MFVVHGMGQQTTFESASAVAEELRGSAPGVVRAVQIGDERLHRIETNVGGREVHVYEAYWAPLTEGNVGIRDVIAFLTRAGFGGFANSFKKFRRWMFGDVWKLKREIGTPIWLLIALVIVVALVGINAAVATVGLSRMTSLGAGKEWPSAALASDLNVTSSIVVSVTLMFAAILFLAIRTKKAVAIERKKDPSIRPWRMSRTLTIGGRVHAASLGIVIVGVAVAMIAQLKHHRDPAQTTWWPAHFGAELVDKISAVTWLVSAFALVMLAMGMLKLPAWAAKTLLRGSLVGSTLMFIFFALIAADVWGAGITGLVAGLGAYHWIFWPLLVGVTWLIRKLLVQYVGDVAAYVAPQTLDRFNQLRESIKACVMKSAKAIYAASPDGTTAEYATVTVVAHSLGSVVAYDTLNRLINDDALGKGPYDVAARTAGLLTFGSPLDKIAYIFSLRRDTDAADAMAASVQPMLLAHDGQPVRTFPWVNLYAPDDIISGSLDYFHAGPGAPVINIHDEFASIPLVAHTEYWSNDLLWDTLKKMIAGQTITAPVRARAVTSPEMAR